MDKTTVIVTIVVAIFGSTGFWSLLNTYILNKKKAKSDETKLIMGIAYRNIIAQCEKYIKRGYIEPDEFNELYRYLFEPYSNMGGNGTAQKMMNEVRQLPSERQE